jgi:molybdopterin-containing oxidoreductase family membrane subunit
MDFSEALVPGWHSTIFPPYFVAGAIFSGFAMVLTLAIPLRALLGLQNLITIRHIDNCCKLLLVNGLLVAYGYACEIYTGWYSGSVYERYMTLNRFIGPYAPVYWTLIGCNVVAPQALWSRRVRRNVYLVFALSLVVNVGMWLERFMIIVTSLHRDYLPSNWGMYSPTFWDWATFLGTVGLFFCLFFLFARVLPVVSMAEVRELVHSTAGGAHPPVTMGPSHAH